MIDHHGRKQERVGDEAELIVANIGEASFPANIRMFTVKINV